MEDKIQEYLKKPYSRILIPDFESGGFAAQILEFPGCFSEGKTPQKAYQNLEEAAYNWLESAIEQGMEIPAPFSAESYSGKVALRMPKSLHRQAMAIAKREGVSLNQFLVSAVASCVGADNLYEKMADRWEAKVNVAFASSGMTVNLLSAAISPSVAMNSAIGTFLRYPSKPTKWQWVEAASLSPESLLVAETRTCGVVQ
jgi:predicted RNase H-like HicB family nuclease